MLELIYPGGPAPLIPSLTADGPRTEQLSGEFFPVVEPNGLVVGKALRSYCHSGAKPLHPVVHIHIMDRMERIYLQKRSMKKDIQPGKWDTAVGGHVDYGEEIIEAVYREASEELGLNGFNPVYLESYVFESQVEKELVNVFAAIGSFELKPDHDEVDEGRWWKLSDISANIGKEVFTPNFESEFLKVKDRLIALL